MFDGSVSIVLDCWPSLEKVSYASQVVIARGLVLPSWLCHKLLGLAVALWVVRAACDVAEAPYFFELDEFSKRELKAVVRNQRLRDSLPSKVLLQLVNDSSARSGSLAGQLQQSC